MQAYDDNSIKEYILEVDVSFPKQLQKIQSDLPILPERMKIEKYQKVICNMYDKKNYPIHIKAVKQTLNWIKKHGRSLHRHEHRIKKKGQLRTTSLS